MSEATNAYERVTVNLTKRSSEALSEVAEATGDNKTTVINRSLQIYRYIERETQDGKELAFISKADGTIQKVTIF